MSRLVVGGFAATRVAIGVAAALSPDRFAGSPDGASGSLMTRSFAVREAVLGIGGLVALADAAGSSTAPRMWAGLGALTDAGDLAAALAAVRRREPSAHLSALLAAIGFAAEAWAFSRLARTRSEKS